VSIADRLRGTRESTATSADTALTERVERLTEQLHGETESRVNLEETITELELALEDVGWRRLIANGDHEFTREGLRTISRMSQLYAVKNPLIRRGLGLRVYYVWGQGVSIAARDEQVNAVVQAFLDDEGNQAELTGHQAKEDKERALGTDGNLFFTLFTNPTTGRVQVRSIPFDEIEDVIRNPEDKRETWYYKRQWTHDDFNHETGTTTTKTLVTWYPDFRYRPKIRPQSIGGHPVKWDAPVMHVKVGGLDGWKFGLAEVYAALDWARAYKEFLDDWKSLTKSLSRYAWRATTKGSKVSDLRRTVTAARNDPARSSNPAAAGAVFASTSDTELSAIPKTGATIDATSGRPLALMVAAALDVPYTQLMGDPDVGNLATAKTLDRPTELAMLNRQQLWTTILKNLCNYVVDQAVDAPQGPLKGATVTDTRGLQTTDLEGDLDRTVDVTWPPILETDVKGVIEAITKADSTGKLPPEVTLRLLLNALGVEDADTIVADAIAAAEDADDEAAAEAGVNEVLVRALDRVIETLRPAS
jgi:hypothetical protein